MTRCVSSDGGSAQWYVDDNGVTDIVSAPMQHYSIPDSPSSPEEQCTEVVDVRDDGDEHGDGDGGIDEAERRLEEILIAFLQESDFSASARRLVQSVSGLYQCALRRMRRALSRQAEEFSAVRLALEQTQSVMTARQMEEVDRIRADELVKREDAVERTRNIFADELAREKRAFHDGAPPLVAGEAEALAGTETAIFSFLPRRLHHLSAESMHFRLAESQFYRVMRNGAHLKVTRVDYVVNPALVGPFNALRQSANAAPILLFHGTRAENIAAICQSGFYDPTHPLFRVVNGQALGAGIYFAEHTDTSIQYAASSMRLLLCQVIPTDGERRDGGVWVVTSSARCLPTYVVHFSQSADVRHQDDGTLPAPTNAYAHAPIMANVLSSTFAAPTRSKRKHKRHR